MPQKQGLRSHANDEAWGVEIQALKDIQEGKTDMEVQSADELIKETLIFLNVSAANYKEFP
ncbi:MAG: hypothetical protein L0H53_00825 [Candidatus Nitrosocosmicus sp.]|nr:hypothetical protein [Candidatus Nitrosocosmicus sp.]MDN5865961.1 hypothetical protein [Candidatus Nitrosocosmicus sp.]